MEALARCRRILYVLTGGVQSVLGPSRVSWLRSELPDAEIIVGMSEMSLRFTTRTAVEALGRCRIVMDSWAEFEPDAHHVDLAEWPDGVLVHPASVNYLSKLACGSGSGPVLLTLQTTIAPIVICPGVPPGAMDNPIIVDNLKRLSMRPNVTILPPSPGLSLRTGENTAGAPAEFRDAVLALEELRLELDVRKG